MECEILKLTKLHSTICFPSPFQDFNCLLGQLHLISPLQEKRQRKPPTVSYQMVSFLRKMDLKLVIDHFFLSFYVGITPNPTPVCPTEDIHVSPVNFLTKVPT